jgi:inorganic pyrophosphatase
MEGFFAAPSDPGPDCPDAVRMVIEIPKDSMNKYEYDAELKLFKLSRVLYSPFQYPGDYGFVPGTIAEDGEPLDVLALVTHPSFPGCVSLVRPIAVLDMVDEGQPDHKIIAVAVRDPRHTPIEEMAQAPAHVRKEIEHFFEIYKELEGKRSRIEGWRGAEAARSVVLGSRERYCASEATG